MKRNPQGVVDKRIRATLRPMSKNRRDSSVCELEQRLRDVKTNNCRFRKALLEKEAELQVISSRARLLTILCNKSFILLFCHRHSFVNWDQRRVHGSTEPTVNRNRCSIDRHCLFRLCVVICPVQQMSPTWHQSVVWRRHMNQSTLQR